MGVFYMIPPEFGPCGPTVTAAAHSGQCRRGGMNSSSHTSGSSANVPGRRGLAGVAPMRSRSYSGPTGPKLGGNHVKHSH